MPSVINKRVQNRRKNIKRSLTNISKDTDPVKWNIRCEGWLSAIDSLSIRFALSVVLIYEIAHFVLTKIQI